MTGWRRIGGRARLAAGVGLVAVAVGLAALAGSAGGGDPGRRPAGPPARPRGRRAGRLGTGRAGWAHPVRARRAVRVLGPDGRAGPAAGVLRGRRRLLGLPVVRAGHGAVRRPGGRRRRPVAWPPACSTSTTPATPSTAGRRCSSPPAPATSSPATPSAPTGPADAPGGHRPPPRPRQRHRRPRLGVPAGAGPAPGVRGRLQRRQHRLDPARPPDPPAVPATPRWPSSATPSATCSASRPICGSCGGPTGCCPTGCRACGRSRGPASPCRGSTRRSPPTTRGRRSPRSTSPRTASSARFHEAAGGARDRSARPCWATWPPSGPARPNFRSCLLEGSAHCALPSPDFYSLASGGVSLRDWVAAQANGDPVANLPPGS